MRTASVVCPAGQVSAAVMLVTGAGASIICTPQGSFTGTYKAEVSNDALAPGFGATPTRLHTQAVGSVDYPVNWNDHDEIVNANGKRSSNIAYAVRWVRLDNTNGTAPVAIGVSDPHATLV